MVAKSKNAEASAAVKVDKVQKKAAKAPEKKSAKQSKPSSDQRSGLFSRIGGYFHDVRLELKRVVWPSRSEVINSSIVVVVTLIFFMAFTFIIDAAIVPLLNLFSKLG